MKKYILLLIVTFSLVGTENMFSQNEPFLGEIKMFSGNFPPKGWAFCNGQLLPINQNQALFAILGTTYGGDGSVNFALPDLRGRVPIHTDNTNYYLGQKEGTETNTITVNQLPAHNHFINAVSTNGNQNSPEGTYLANSRATDKEYSNTTPDKTMKATMINNTGGGQPVNNMQPYIVITYIIALQGVFPSQN